jgi:PRC-barrel domain
VWNSARQGMDAPGLIPPLIGAPLSSRSGGVAGTVEDLLVDAASHRPVWLLVRLDGVGAPYTFVPAEHMASRTGSVVVPFDEKALRETPVRLAAPSGCGREHAAVLSRHYGVRVPPGEARGLRAAAWADALSSSAAA